MSFMGGQQQPQQVVASVIALPTSNPYGTQQLVEGVKRAVDGGDSAIAQKGEWVVVAECRYA
jgi:hypothetical protein